MNKTRTAFGIVCMSLILALVGSSNLWATEEFEKGQSITMEGYIRVAERDISGNITSLDFVAKDTNEMFRISCEAEGKSRELCDHEGKLVEIQGTLRRAEGEPTDSTAPAWFLEVVEYEVKEVEPPAEEPAPPADEGSAEEISIDEGSAEKVSADEEKEQEEQQRLELQGEFRVAEFDEEGNAKSMEFVEKGTAKIYKVANDDNHEKYVELARQPLFLTGELKTDEAGVEWLHVLEYKMAEEENPTIPEKGGEEW